VIGLIISSWLTSSGYVLVEGFTTAAIVPVIASAAVVFVSDNRNGSYAPFGVSILMLPLMVLGPDVRSSAST